MENGELVNWSRARSEDQLKKYLVRVGLSAGEREGGRQLPINPGTKRAHYKLLPLPGGSGSISRIRPSIEGGKKGREGKKKLLAASNQDSTPSRKGGDEQDSKFKGFVG